MIETCEIEAWVEAATPERREFREAVHTILFAIARAPALNPIMVLKGGILMAIHYQSDRHTTDIDFSTELPRPSVNPDAITHLLSRSLSLATVSLGYDLDCLIQRSRFKPSDALTCTIPTLKITVGYARRGSTRHKRLLAKECPTAVNIDFSVNERLPNIERLAIGDEAEIAAYRLTDLIAEKLRSVLQQVVRNRQRRQDIYDLALLIDQFPDLPHQDRQTILDSLRLKAESRGISPTRTDLRNDTIRARSRAEYGTLATEIDHALPNFDEIYERVRGFYESLPW